MLSTNSDLDAGNVSWPGAMTTVDPWLFVPTHYHQATHLSFEQAEPEQGVCRAVCSISSRTFSFIDCILLDQPFEMKSVPIVRTENSRRLMVPSRGSYMSCPPNTSRPKDSRTFPCTFRHFLRLQQLFLSPLYPALSTSSIMSRPMTSNDRPRVTDDDPISEVSDMQLVK